MLNSQLFLVEVSAEFKTLLSCATFGEWLADKKKTKKEEGTATSLQSPLY